MIARPCLDCGNQEAQTITARIKLRNDHGPSGELSEPQEFVLIDGLYYPLKRIKSGQGLRREQLEFN